MKANKVRAAALALSGAVVLVGTSLFGAAPASSAPGSAAVGAAYSCDEARHENRANLDNSVKGGTWVKAGPYQECNERFSGFVSVKVFCWYKNAHGNYWWFVKAGTRQGWVFEDNLSNYTPKGEFWECPN